MRIGKTAEFSVVYGLAALVLAGAALTDGALAAAPAGSPSRAPAVQKMLDCRALVDNAQRLDCFDKASAAIVDAEKTGDLITIDRAQRRAVRRQAFGLQLPSLAIFDKGEKPEEADRITATLAGVGHTADGKWLLKLEDGALWRQTDDSELLKDPHKGSTIEIRKGVLGAFFIKVDGQQAFRAHRDN